MAKVFGESARYISQEAVKRHERVMWRIAIMIGICGVVEGVCVSNFVPAAFLPLWFRLLAPVAGLTGFWLVNKGSIKRLGELEKERMAARRGAAGEALVGHILSDLPDDYYVVNDLSAEWGNLDHVVIGPNGIFVVETKNWRGNIALNQKGELTLNGQETAKAHIGPLLKRMLDVREKARVLAPGVDPFYHVVIVFTSAWVDERHCQSDKVCCLRDDHLFDYIVERKSNAPLNKQEAQRLAQAFLGLAHADTEFTRALARPVTA